MRDVKQREDLVRGMFNLISVAIMSYNNTQFIYECIDSVLDQDYPEIELIISDDASEQFDEMSIREYIVKYKKDNVKDVQINRNGANLGTVKHANKILQMVNGELIKFLACDDILAYPTTISKYVTYLNTYGVGVMAAQMEVYNCEMSTMLAVYPSFNYLKKFERIDGKKIYNNFAVCNILGGASTCWKTEFLKRLGGFDERYILLEDWPIWLRIARLGYTIGFLNEVTIKYRMGGVSTNKDNFAVDQIGKDFFMLQKLEIQPNKKRLSIWRRRECNFIFAKEIVSGTKLKKYIVYLMYLDVIGKRKINLLVNRLRGVRKYV